MSTNYLVAVDPGLDAAGVAVFDLQGTWTFKGLEPPPLADRIRRWEGRDSFADALRRLARHEVIRTSPKWDLPVRLGWLARGLREVTPHGSSHVLVERSRIPGVYAQARARQQTKNAINAAALEKLFFAIGALVAGVESHAGSVELIAAPASKKEIRHRAVQWELERQGHPIMRQARQSPDLLDAIWLGATWLSDPRRRAAA